MSDPRYRLQQELDECRAENERLRALSQMAEVERLIKTLREWQEGYPGKLITENERLREAIRAGDMRTQTLEAEIGHLRAELRLKAMKYGTEE